MLPKSSQLKQLIRMIKTDIIIIGAGPVGLFTVFEAGLMKLRCHLIDTIPQIGGQLSELYPKKPIYDIPGFPSILAGKLVENLMEQASPFNPGFTLGERAEKIVKNNDNSFTVITDKNTEHNAPIVIISGGLGSFEPRKPILENLQKYEDNGVDYMIKDPQKFKDKSVIIAGGGDSALDWTIFLADICKSVTLIHRRNEFRGALDSVDKVIELKDKNKVNVITPAEVEKLHGDKKLEKITIRINQDNLKEISTDFFIPLFGLSPKLGPLSEWGFDIEKNAIKVDTFDYQTNIPGIFAIGDINTYKGKLKLILCGFHEATLMCQSAYKILNPGKNLILKYTTVSGVHGFDGSKKEAEKSVIKSINS